MVYLSNNELHEQNGEFLSVVLLYLHIMYVVYRFINSSSFGAHENHWRYKKSPMPIWGIPPLLMNCTFHYSIDCAHCDRTLGIQAAWPDDEIKVAQIDPIVAQIIPKAVFIKMFCFFLIWPKKLLYIWVSFATKSFTTNFQKSPNLVTLDPRPFWTEVVCSFCTYKMSLSAKEVLGRSVDGKATVVFVKIALCLERPK